MNFKCRYCGNSSYIVKPFSGSSSINAIGLYCKRCGKWHKWLNKEERKLYYKESRTTSSNSNTCLYCGEIIPEGIQVCPNCHDKLTTVIAEEKSLRWVCNQIPDNLDNSREDKMLYAIKNHCKSGADKIHKLVMENEDIRQNSISHNALKDIIKQLVDRLRYSSWNTLEEIEKMTSKEYADKVEKELKAICKEFNIDDNDTEESSDEVPW